MPAVVVQVAALDGTWENCGVDRVNGIVPENLRADADMWGSKGCTFDLRRDPSAVWPDISAFTPVKVIIDGSLVWSGRVSETPSRDGVEQVMSVACEGWQHHLDDDMYERKYVHNRLSDWQDQRSMLTADLAVFQQGPQVQVGQGSIVLGYPKGCALNGNTKVGVTLDLGPSSVGASRVSMNFATVGADGNVTVTVKGTDVADQTSTGDTILSWTMTSPPSSPATGGASFTAPRRFIHVTMSHAFSGTAGADADLKITDLRVMTDSAYESAGLSVLKASAVITDALSRGTALLSSDRSGITTTSFSIPEFAPSEPRTPREMWDAVNAYHGWQSKIDVDKRPVFQALPTRPKYEVGDWSAVEVTDSSANSGQDIYNNVIVTGQDPAGQPVRVTRAAGQLSGSSFTTDRGVSVSNPSFDTNTTGWNASTGTLARTTTAGEFSSTPAGGRLTTVASFASVQPTITGAFVTGRAYRITFQFKMNSAAVLTGPGAAATINVSFGAGGRYASVPLPLTTAFQQVTVDFALLPGESINATSGISLSIADTTGRILYFDDFAILSVTPTLPDRRGFSRTKQLAVNSTLPTDGVAAAKIGDTWLAGHTTTPFRGSVTLTGPNALRNRLSGQPVPLAELLCNTGELIYFADGPDPDTGAAGRNGRIAAVSYDPAADVASVTLDNTRSDLDNLLSRRAVVQGG